MSKYIIELGEDAKAIQSISITSLGNVYVDSWYVENLEELNSDYINEHFGDLQDTAYQKGLNDAWECARKIVCDDTCGGMSMKELVEIFNKSSDAYIIRDYTAQQAIEKIKAYEKKQADKIEVGDEVTHKSDSVKWTAIVTRISCGTLTLMEHSGAIADNYPIEDFVKTGRHFDIQKILEAMKA